MYRFFHISFCRVCGLFCDVACLTSWIDAFDANIGFAALIALTGLQTIDGDRD